MEEELKVMGKVIKILQPLSETQRLFVLGSAAYHLGLNAQGSALFALLADKLRETTA